MKERINPSKFVIIITLSVLLFTIYSFFAFKETVIVSIILTLLNLFLFISYPLSIVKEPEHIIINRIKGKVIFNIEDYKKVELALSVNDEKNEDVSNEAPTIDSDINDKDNTEK